MFYEVFVDKLTLETYGNLFLRPRVDQQISFHRFGRNWRQLTFLNIKSPLKYVMELSVLFSWVFLANWFRTIFCIFISLFPNLHLFLINCDLFRIRNRLWTFSTHFYLFTNRFCSFLIVYQSFLLVLFVIYQSFLLVYESFPLVSTHFPISATRLTIVLHWSANTRTISNFQCK